MFLCGIYLRSTVDTNVFAHSSYMSQISLTLLNQKIVANNKKYQFQLENIGTTQCFQVELSAEFGDADKYTLTDVTPMGRSKVLHLKLQIKHDEKLKGVNISVYRDHEYFVCGASCLIGAVKKEEED